jgi:hypothetical protein
MSEEIKIEDVALSNQEFLAAIEAAPDGQLKNASVAGTKMIKRRIREAGFARMILPFKPVVDPTQRLPDSDMPVVVEEMEPDSPGAKSAAFMDSPDTVFFHGDTFVVYFHKILTPEFKKNIDQLRTYKNDLKAVITENALRDVHTAEDTGFMAEVDDIVGAVGGVGAAGVQQNFSIVGGITRSNYPLIQNYLEDRELMNGVYLQNRNTAKVFQTWPREEIGGDLAERLFTDGASALVGGKIGGVPHIWTMKKALVPNNVVYQFAEPDYLGRAYVLQDLTLYVEKKKDIITFSAMEKIGMTFANVAGLNRVQFGAEE